MNSFEKLGGPFSSELESEEKKIEKDYRTLLESYQIKVRQIQIYERKNKGILDEETRSQILTLDKQRHEVHLKLIELGEKISKNKDDVLTDIIRRNGTLEEYGLPQLSILTQKDFIKTGDSYEKYIFNEPSDPEFTEDNLARVTKEYNNQRAEFADFLKDDELLIVFDFTSRYYDDETKDVVEGEFEDGIFEKVFQLADEVKGRVFTEETSQYHEGVTILGIIIKKSDLESVALVIRNNPQKYDF